VNLRIGTRRSKLAIAQAEEVRMLLGAVGVDSELVPMSTAGDEGSDAMDAPAGLKGLFVDTILEALEEGEVDVAVHSAKDLPAEDNVGLIIAAVPVRADPFDVLLLRSETIPSGGVIGTSSIRRKAQLLRSFPGIDVEDIRGNVDTRLRKLDEGVVDALVLASAGLARLGIVPAHGKALSLEQMVPAPGQGSLAVQAREDDDDTLRALSGLDHVPSHVALEAERSLMWRLGGGCSLPLGAYAEVETDRVHLTALVVSPDGSRAARTEVESDSAEGAATIATKELLAQGAEAILAEVAGPS
jgi:hydroxymethylbilane synthase